MPYAEQGVALQAQRLEAVGLRDAGVRRRAELNEALRAFTRRSVGADVALVLYAGHGMVMLDDDVLAAATGASSRL